jgi:hypothetical protein
MADQKHTPEIVNAALDPDERIQYRSLVNLILDNKVLNTQQAGIYGTSYSPPEMLCLDE